MTLRAYPFDNVVTTEVDVSKLFREFQNSGIAASADAQDFSVYATGSDGMQVFVRAGFALINGYALDSSAVQQKNIQAASTSQRYDLVVLRADPGNNSITPEVLTGTVGGGIPVPTWTNTDICELPLAVVTVRANVTAIDATDVADSRKFLTGSVGVWKDGGQPTAPRIAQLGYNLTKKQWEYWDGTTWTPNVPSNLVVASVDADSMTVGSDNRKVLGSSVWGDAAAAFGATPEGTSVLSGITLFSQKGTLTSVKNGTSGRQEFIASDGDSAWTHTVGSCFMAWRSVDLATGNWGQWHKVSWSAMHDDLVTTVTLTPDRRRADGVTYGTTRLTFPPGWFPNDGDYPRIFIQVASFAAAAAGWSGIVYDVGNDACTIRCDFPLKMTSAVAVYVLAKRSSWSS